jgi:hypothetical protein
MTITMINNSSVSPRTRDKAAKKAKKDGQNVVVYRLQDDPCNNEYLSTQTDFATAPENDKVVFLAILDKNGQYVD